ncbi:MAG: aliphatic sulfonate ABC transporter substrate-binding protein [Firmicutes bacterium]|nr:aliphatic sulfonate ABC transporter substrate-binding protein [Bacillota bacterium]
MRGRALKVLVLMLVLGLIISLTGCGGGEEPGAENNQSGEDGQKLDKVSVTLTTWPGYGPLFLARDKGFFAEEGLEDVEITIIQGLAERKQALAGNKVDGMATTLDIEATLEDAGIPVSIIWALDTSYGGDGILASKDIKELADLKGKSVALDVGTTSHIFLLTALDKAGLTEDDVNIVPVSSSGDAGAAFVAGNVDAAVTWEPWLTKGVEEGNGHLAITSKDTPGLIMDALAFRKDFADTHPEEMQAMVNGLVKAMEYYEENQEDAVKIMAEGLKMETENFLDGIKLYNYQENVELFAGEINETLNRAADFYVEKGIISARPDTANMIDSSYLESVSK